MFAEEHPIFAVVQMMIAIPLATARLLALLMIMPLFRMLAARGILEMAAAFALGFPLAVNLAGQAGHLDIGLADYVILVIKEALIGGMIGWLLGVPIWAMQASGDIFDNVKGDAQATVMDPGGSEDMLLSGQFLSLLYVAYLASSGGLILILGLVYETFVLWPITAFLPAFSEAGLASLVGVLQQVVLIALTVGAPLIFVMFGIDVMIAFIARSAPNMDALTFGFSVKSLIGAMMLLVYMAVVPGVFGLIEDYYAGVIDSLKDAIHGG